MSSFASVKGPSTTVRFAPEYLTRHPLELACSPEASSRTPAFCSSSWYFAIFARIGSCGMTPASESFVAFTMIMNRMTLCSFLALRRLRAHALLLLPELGPECGTEVLGLEHLANLDLGAVPEGRPLDPLDGFCFRLHLPQPEAGDQLLRFGEGSVGHGSLPAGELHARALRARRSEEHTSELQSQSNLVCRLLLEKKKKKKIKIKCSVIKK